MDNRDQSTDSEGEHGRHEAGTAELGDEAETYHGEHEAGGSETPDDEEGPTDPQVKP